MRVLAPVGWEQGSALLHNLPGRGHTLVPMCPHAWDEGEDGVSGSFPLEGLVNAGATGHGRVANRLEVAL